MSFKRVPVNSAKIPATASNFPVYIKPSALTGWGSITLAEAQSSRWYTDESKTTEVAREIVSADEIHVKVPSLTTTTELFVDYDGIRADYAVTDTYGRNAVWGDYMFVAHLNNNTDSSGNTTLTNTSVDFNSAQIGDGAFYNATSDRLSAGTTSAMEIERTDSATWQSWARRTNDSSSLMVLSRQQNSSPFRGYALYTGTSGTMDFVLLNNGTANGILTRSTAMMPSTNTWYMLHITYNGSSNANGVIHYQNGASFSKSNIANTLSQTIVASVSFQVGNRDGATLAWSNLLDEQRIRKSVLSANWITTEYNNQSDVATFFGTVTDAGGAVANNGFQLWWA